MKREFEIVFRMCYKRSECRERIILRTNAGARWWSRIEYRLWCAVSLCTYACCGWVNWKKWRRIYRILIGNQRHRSVLTQITRDRETEPNEIMRRFFINKRPMCAWIYSLFVNVCASYVSTIGSSGYRQLVSLPSHCITSCSIRVVVYSRWQPITNIRYLMDEQRQVAQWISNWKVSSSDWNFMDGNRYRHCQVENVSEMEYLLSNAEPLYHSPSSSFSRCDLCAWAVDGYGDGTVYSTYDLCSSK